ncbi:MAG TPA: glycosyltransferase family protein [Ignavibacteria bacterium]|nr:glycosyltransferase family protein [Ignavibacteria bacterium]
MSKIAFIAARMGSERLPGKVIKELFGIPSLVHIFNILKECKNLDDFAVVTTVLAEDDIIENICTENSVKIIRGSVHDVLDRFRVAAEILKPDRIIRVTGDDPLMDPEIIDHVIGEHCSGNFDYTSNIAERTYPRGMDTEVIEYEALERCWRNTSDKDDHEHVTLFIRRNPELFRIHSVRKEGEPMDDLRLCLDTEQDYDLLKEIYDNLYQSRPIRLTEVIEFLKINPELKKINSGILQKSVKGKIF